MNMKRKERSYILFTLSITCFLILHCSSTFAVMQKENLQLKGDVSSLSTVGQQKPAYVEGEVLVKLKKTGDFAITRNLASSLLVEVKKQFRFLSKRRGRTYVLLRSRRIRIGPNIGKPEISTIELMGELLKNPQVEAVSPNYYRYKADIPTDPLFDLLWGLHNTGQTGGTEDADIDAPEAWDIRTDCSSVILASIDSGVDYTHEDLASNMWVNPGEIPGNGLDDDGNGYVDDIHGIDAGEDDSDPMDKDGHGTHTAGTMAATGNNGTGVAGVCWNTKIMAVKAKDTEGEFKDSDLIEGISYVTMMKTEKGQKIAAINASWGGNYYNQLLYDAVEDAGDAGIVFVAAAGNRGYDNDDWPFYPSSFDLWNIVAVAASNHYDGKPAFTNYGRSSVDLAAPGENIWSTVPGYHYDPDPTDIFFDDMESGDGNWTHGGIKDTWAITEEQAYSGTHAWSDSPGLDYENGTHSWLEVNHDIDLSAYIDTNVYLGFHARHNFRNSDYCEVRISKDSGSLFTKLTTLKGNVAEWTLYSFPVPLEFKTSQFRFQFYVYTNSSGTDDGIYIDDVGVGDVGTGPSDRYASMDGTSMAAPHVTGTAGQLASDPAIDLLPAEEACQQVIARILKGTDKKSAFSYKVSTHGRLNVNTSLQLGDLPFIKSAIPHHGVPPGSQVTVTGMNFGDSGGDLLWVRGLSEISVQVQSWANKTIVFRMSEEAAAHDVLELVVENFSGQRSNPVFVYPKRKWINGDALPFSTKFGGGVIAHEGLLYCIQGGGSLMTEGKVGIYDQASATWSTSTSMPEPIIKRPFDVGLGLDENLDPMIVVFSNSFDDVDGIYRFNLRTETWDSKPFPEGFPTEGLYNLEIVSMLNHTGQNICYISGGTGSSTLWEYHPDTNTIINLGNFTIAESLYDHVSFYVNWIGSSGALCVAGGVGVAGSTQCYDIASSSFRPPNTDIPQLPGAIESAADIQDNGDLWVVGGEFNGDRSYRTYYFNSAQTDWVQGPSLIYPVKWAEGAFLNDALYLVGGDYVSDPTRFTQVLYPATSIDTDDDGIYNTIDGYVAGTPPSFVDESGVFSGNFTDEHLGGTTHGHIVSRDDLSCTVEDDSLEGVQISATSGIGTATVIVCAFDHHFTDGDSAVITCGSLREQVLTGEVEVYLTDDILVRIPSGATVTITELPEQKYEIANSPGSTASVTVEVQGRPTIIDPGDLKALSTDFCQGDFAHDGDVDGSDLAIFAADFGRTDCDSGSDCEGDFDGDGDVDGSDLAVFAADFGRTDCPE